ncbi:MAG: alpha/beta hydrolase [Chloroflexota bacterium]
MASPQLAILIQALRTQPFDENASIQDTRVGFEAYASGFAVAADVTRERVDAGGVAGEWITTPSVGATTVLYLHGGGYVIGSTNTHADLVSRIGRAAGARALAINYRLAPEYPHPAAVEDATTAYRWLLAQGASPEAIVIVGDSAGGGLTAATLLALKDAGNPMPAAAVLISPWTDLALTGESVRTREAADPALSPGILAKWSSAYCDGRPSTDPLISPLYGDHGGLPPLLVIAGDAEILLDDSVRYAERARAAGVDVTLEVWDEMLHIFPIFAGMLPEGQQAIERIGAFIKEHINTGVTA